MPGARGMLEQMLTPGVRLRALVPNLVGAERAIAAGADEFCLVLLASETFQRKNVRASVAEALQRYAAVVALAVAHGVRVQGGVGLQTLGLVAKAGPRSRRFPA